MGGNYSFVSAVLVCVKRCCQLYNHTLESFQVRTWHEKLTFRGPPEVLELGPLWLKQRVWKYFTILDTIWLKARDCMSKPYNNIQVFVFYKSN